MRPFTIIPVLNGYIVDIGCQKVVFISNKALEDAIHEYLREPEKTEELFLTQALHPTVSVEPPVERSQIVETGCNTSPRY